MENFRVHYSGACFERGNSLEQVERRVHDREISQGEILGVEATFLHPDQRDHGEENDVVGIETEIPFKIEIEN